MRNQIRVFLSQPLLMDPAFAERLAIYADSQADNAKGIFFQTHCPIQAAEKQIAAAKQAPMTRKLTAVLPVCGMIDQKGSWILDVMGGTSVESLMAAFEMCMNEDRIHNVLFDHHSPGGSVYLVKEFADKIHAARGTKPIVSVANSLMASASYYLGAACDRVYATIGADVGSIGVYQIHFDQSEAMKEMGVTPTIVKSQPYKAEGNPFEPLSPEAKAEMQSDVDRIDRQFYADVCRYRGVDDKTARELFGQGRTIDATTAQKVGMINRVATFEDVLSRMRAGTIRPSNAAAAMDDWDGTLRDVEDEQKQRRRRLAMTSNKEKL